MEYIAHIIEENGKIQTVKEHSENVRKLSEYYCRYLPLENILIIASRLHDAGKNAKDFGSYVKGENNLTRGSIDHSFAGAKYIIEFAGQFDDIKLITAAEFIARIIISHHGLHDWIDKNYCDYLRERIKKDERYSEICKEIDNQIDKEELKKLLELASKEYDNLCSICRGVCEQMQINIEGNDKEKCRSLVRQRKRESFHFYKGMYERLAQSVLVDADRTDTAEFMNGIKIKNFSSEELEQIFETMCENIEKMNDKFSKNPNKITKYRMDISERCKEFALEERGICRLVVPTGGGKTISSTRFAANYCKRFHKEKIFYIAPFMSILEQNTDVLKEIVGNKEFLLEHHSNIFSRFDNDNDEELNKYELKAECWNIPIISTTMVQFLNTLFSAKMSSVRRFHRLVNSVIIIDEVQSVPIKCTHMFNLAMNFLSKMCNCTIVLCSATQPSFENAEYPLIFDDEQSISGDFSEDFENFKRTEIISALKTEQYTFSQAADFAYEKYLENNNLLVIMNTKKSALEIFKQIKELNQTDAEVIYLSASMCPAHRNDKLKGLKELLKENKPVICVTTQVIEAGVDISFDCVIRSLAGVESIAQAAGRCNRHGENGIKPVYVINVSDENLGSLAEIKTKQDISYGFIEKYGSKLLENDIINIYFRKLFKENRQLLSFPCRNGPDNLIDLLSVNRERTALFISKNKYKISVKQAFKTAGEEFAVIDQNTQSIIIPYNEEAKEIILNLNSDIDAKQEIKLLRKAQKFIVSVYPNAFSSMLEKKQIFQLKCGAFALNDEYFNEDYGIESENVMHEILNF